MQPSPSLLGRTAAGVLAVLFLITWLHPADASPPATNDTCADALLIPGNGPFPYLTTIMDVSAATTNGDPALPVLLGNCGGVTLGNLSRSVWYKFTPGASALYGFSLGPDTLTTIADTVMAIYTSPTGCAGPSTGFDCNDDSGAEQRSGLTASLVAGTTYYIVVWGAFSAEPIGEILDVQLRVTKPVVPANNTCAGAISIPASGPFPHQTTTNDTILADEIGDPVDTGCLGVEDRVRSVWYKFVPGTDGLYVFSTGTETATTIDTTAMTLYRNNAGCGSEFVFQICSANVVGRAVITANLLAGNSYYLVVWDTSPDYIVGETSLQIRVVKVLAPTVTTLPAASITSTGATLGAQINLYGVQGRYWFEWGTSTNYTSTNSARLLNASSVLLTTNSPVTGFLPGTNYHFRAVATNAVGRTYGADQVFHWLNGQPLITSPVRLPGGNFQFQFNGTASQLYVVQGSTNLPAWVDLGAATDLGGGLFEFIHTSTAGAPFRFYKVRVP
jgi:hypothetical protein